MNHDVFTDAERYEKKNRQKRGWKKIVTCLAAIVVFCTTYALILPAITMERTPYCKFANNEVHTHTEKCYSESGELICGYADYVVHHHDTSCYDESGNLWCAFPEIETHVHDDSCYEVTDTGEKELVCAKEEIQLHEHSGNCYDEDGNLICGKVQVLAHQHSDACLEQVEKASEEEVHDSGQMVREVIALIDALPTSEEVEERLTALDEAGDEEQYADYYESVMHQAREAYLLYCEIDSELQSQVTNIDKLKDLEWIYAVQTFDVTNTVTIQQVNCFGSASGGTDRNLLIYNDSDTVKRVNTIVSNLYQFPQATAITVENRNGQLVVTEVDTAGTNKREKDVPVKGFIIIIPTGGNIVAEAGNSVSVDFDYTKSAYNVSGLGTVTFSSTTSSSLKPEKDNSSKLTIVPGADTRDLIEVNLYDYGTNINELYNGDKKYPGFQQDRGSTNVGSAFNKFSSFNFGNNITSDLAAGIANVTNKGGTINTTTNVANSPISGAMKSTLGSDGQPALADGTSLGYLFSNNTYAVKQNSQSINGLFQYHEDTGAYTFNSRENHAQFNSGTDTFTLYNQIISSNFMMYPFGNFLPFNDIVHQSAQTSTIDKAYLETIAESAQNKYENNYGAEYGTLATQLKNFIQLMDNAYPNGWTGVDCMNEYFKAANIPRTFSQDEALIQDLYSIDYDEPTDFYFGMEMKMNFMQPKGGLTGKDGKQPMVFYFTGDDDVWVYLDGKLFLDLSGIHRHVGGEIDFVNGVVKYYDLDVSTGDVSTTPSKTVKFSELVSTGLNAKGTFEDYSTHRFNFYYMERGAESGVCRMNFNFPLLHKNTISVTKELSVDENGKEEVLGNPDFQFQVLKENGTELFIGAGTTYRILDTAGNEIGTGTTDANGVFTLKAGQTAVFKDIAENAGRYLVRELLDPSVFEQYGTISVDGSSLTTNYDVTIGQDQFKGVNSPVKDMSDGSTAFHFDNRVTLNKTGSLKITKKLETYAKARSTEKFRFTVTLDGQPLPAGTTYSVGAEKRTVVEPGIIELAPDETAVISGILAGTRYEVQEQEESAKGYCITYVVDGATISGTVASGVIQKESSVEVNVTNSEKGTSVEIPVSKTLKDPDGQEHHYKIQLQQIKSDTDPEPVSPEFTQEIDLTMKDTQIDDRFVINYLEKDMTDIPATYYYKISEWKDPEEKNTIFDDSVYIVGVTITKDDAGNLTADITSVKKNGETLNYQTGDSLSFVNQMEWYELPETGGKGTIPYTMGGVLLIFSAAVVLLYRYRKTGKEGKESS